METINDINLDTAFKVAWAGFLRLGEITYTHAERNNSSFKDLHITRSDVTFSKLDQYARLRLKRSKNDANQTGVLMMLAVTHTPKLPRCAD